MLKRYVRFFAVLAFSIAGLCSGMASATNCQWAPSNATGYYTVNLPGSVPMPRDETMGASLVNTGSFSVGGSFMVTNCVNANGGVVNARGPNAPSPGIAQPIGNTGLAWTWSWSGQPLTSYGIYLSGFNGGGGLGGAQHIITLTRIGPVAPGTVIPAGVLGSFNTGDLQNIVVTLANDIVFTPLACSTGDVVVPMGTHQGSEFAGVNTFTASTNFNITLQACPSGINTIKYQIDPTTTVLNAANSVVALDSSSSATGIGVQLLDNSGNALPLGTQQTLAGYNSATGGNYTIPLKARYYQTSSPLGSGSANTSLTFTMSYQ